MNDKGIEIDGGYALQRSPGKTIAMLNILEKLPAETKKNIHIISTPSEHDRRGKQNNLSAQINN